MEETNPTGQCPRWAKPKLAKRQPHSHGYNIVFFKRHPDSQCIHRTAPRLSLPIGYRRQNKLSRRFRLLQALQQVDSSTRKRKGFGLRLTSYPQISRSLGVYLKRFPITRRQIKKAFFFQGCKVVRLMRRGCKVNLIIELDGKKIESIYDYTDAIGLLKTN